MAILTVEGLPGAEDDLLARIDGVHLVAVRKLGTGGDETVGLLCGEETVHGGAGQDLEVRATERGEEVRLWNERL